MKKTLLLCFTAGVLLAACQSKQPKQTHATPAEVAQQVVVADLVPDNVFTAGCEGPAADAAGNVYAVSYQKDGTIGIVTPNGEARLFVELPKGSTGNGIRFDKQGDMFIADYTGHNILKIKKGTKDVEVFAHNSSMNQPNDIAIANSGLLFASDPKWAENTGKLWRIGTNGKTTLLEDNMGTTNGIEVSPDDEHLYVNESVSRIVWKYDLDAEGNISGKRQLYQFADHGMDGMRCDKQGNLYIARYDAGEVAVLSPAGDLIRTVKLKGQKPTNVTFGGPDNKTIYVTMQDRGNIEYFTNDIAGAR